MVLGVTPVKGLFGQVVESCCSKEKHGKKLFISNVLLDLMCVSPTPSLGPNSEPYVSVGKFLPFLFSLLLF